MDDLFQKYLPLLKPHALPLIIGVAGLMFFGYGLIGLGEKKADKQDILFEAASDVNPTAAAAQTSKSPSISPENREIVVDVAGAVMKPGVYKLKVDSRVQDALIAAGGMSEDADREKVAKSINLASKMVDGAKIYVPWQGEKIPDSQENVVLSAANEGLININDASQSELEELPGIGEVTAGKIINGRPYSDINQLLEKKVVGQSVFEKIKDKIEI